MLGPVELSHFAGFASFILICDCIIHIVHLFARWNLVNYILAKARVSIGENHARGHVVPCGAQSPDAPAATLPGEKNSE